MLRFKLLNDHACADPGRYRRISKANRFSLDKQGMMQTLSSFLATLFGNIQSLAAFSLHGSARLRSRLMVPLSLVILCGITSGCGSTNGTGGAVCFADRILGLAIRH